MKKLKKNKLQIKVDYFSRILGETTPSRYSQHPGVLGPIIQAQTCGGLLSLKKLAG